MADSHLSLDVRRRIHLYESAEGTYLVGVRLDNSTPLEITADFPLNLTEAAVSPFASVTRTVVASPTLLETPYVANQQLGNVLTFTNASRYQNGGGVIHTVTLFDYANQRRSTDLFLFSQNFSVTPTANASPVTIAAGDQPNLVGVVSFAATDYVILNGSTGLAIASKNGVGLAFSTTNNQTSLFGVLVTRSNPTYAATSLTVKLSILQD